MTRGEYLLCNGTFIMPTCRRLYCARMAGHSECPEVAPACSPNAYQRRPDRHVNAIGSDKPPYRKLATRKSLGGCMSVPAVIVFFPSQFVPFTHAGCVSADRPTCFFLS
jgi:hypothetical protein